MSDAHDHQQRRATRRVLVTGATGFIGAEVAQHLERAGLQVLRGCRALPDANLRAANWTVYGDLSDLIDRPPLLEGIHGVVHCAGLAAVGAKDAQHAIAVNVEATGKFAAACAAAGVERFVHMSSAQVLGSRSPPGEYLSDTSPIAPDTAYAKTKREAEDRLQEVAARTPLEVVILRPPLVYGRGARGNFRRLVDLIGRGVALPFGCADAPRSFIAVDNLASAVEIALIHPNAPGGAFLVADAEMSSSRDMIERLAQVQGRRAHLISVPESVVRATAALLGARSMIGRLFDPFAIDWSNFASRTNWMPLTTMNDALCAALAPLHEPKAGDK